MAHGHPAAVQDVRLGMALQRLRSCLGLSSDQTAVEALDQGSDIALSAVRIDRLHTG